jgi:hypothetical protein
MRKNRKNKDEANPFPKSGEFASTISDLDNCLRVLRETAKTGADMHSAGHSIAALQVDLIASSFGLLRHVDVLAFQFLEEECPPEERIRRLGCLMRLTGKIQGTILRAIDIYLSSLGGMELIKIQAVAGWIKRLRESAPADAAQIDKILEMMGKKSTK